MIGRNKWQTRLRKHRTVLACTSAFERAIITFVQQDTAPAPGFYWWGHQRGGKGGTCYCVLHGERRAQEREPITGVWGRWGGAAEAESI